MRRDISGESRKDGILTTVRERLLLQICVAVCGCVPVGAGLAGVLLGAGMLDDVAGLPLDSHLRYLSGLLLALGVAFWAGIPAIERQGPRYRLLAALVFCGGLARLGAVLALGFASLPMTLALGMELVVTPLVCLWQARVARHAGQG